MSADLIPPQPLDVVAWVTVRLHTHGGLSTSGTIGDAPMALHLLEQAADAIRRNARARELLVVPGRDVDEAPSIPVRELGMMAPAERGDP